MVSEKIVSCIFHCKPTADNDAPRAGPVWTPGPRLAGFIKRTPIHCYTQNMKAMGLVVSEKKIFMFFPSRPRGGARMDPRGTVGSIYKEDHYTLLYTCIHKNIKALGLVFSEKIFYVFFP